MHLKAIHHRLMAGLASAVLFAGALLGHAPNAAAATVTVNTLTPDSAGDAKCGLTEAVQAVNQQSTYRSCTYTANGQPDRIVFSVNGTHNVGSLFLNRSVEIAGTGASNTVINSPGFCAICSTGASSGGSMTITLKSLAVATTPTSVTFGVYVNTSLPVGLYLDTTSVRGFGVGVYGGGSNVVTSVASSTIENNGIGLAVDFGTLQVISSTVQNNTTHGVSIYQDTNPHYNYISNSTIRNNTGAIGAGVYVESQTDPISNVTLDISGTTFSGNSATDKGGGVYGMATTSITSSVFDGNSAGNMGGGALFEEKLDGFYVYVTSTVFKNNSASYGAGFANYGPSDGQRVKVTLSQSTFGPNNIATADGGGIYSASQIDWAENLTIHGNKAARGGGLFHDSGGESHLLHCTVTANVATQSSGGGGLWLTTGNPMYFYNIIAENKAGAALSASNVVTTNGSLSAKYNLLDDVTGVSGVFPTSAAGGTNIVATPQLGAFGYFGGAGNVRPLLASSPGLDVIPPADGDPVLLDQRGFIRPIDGNLNGTASFDIGAVEMNAAATQYQAESLSVAAQTGEALTLENNANYSGGQGRVKQANVNGSFTLQTGTIQPGTYGVIVWFKKAANAGKFQLAVGASAGSTSNLGSVQDAYRSSAEWTKVNLGTITVNSAGARYFKFTTTTKNASSSGYWMFIDAIQLYKSN
jgi:predicted outer membrane repeat protein